jgi:hypothetical protein
MNTLNDARRILAELTFELDARADIERQVGTPSILCPDCGTHGFVTNGQWVAA